MVPLKPIDLHYAQHMRLHYAANVPPGTTLADVTDPGFWAHHTSRLRPGTLIEVLAEDNSLDCELRVLDVAPTFAKTRVLRNYTPEAAAEPKHALPDDIEIGYGGKVEKWRVIHKNQIVKSGLTTREDAEKAAEEYRIKFAA